jgi:signal peptidase II
MPVRLRILVLLITLLITVGCDQLTKGMAREQLDPGETVVLMDGAVRLRYSENHGAFLSAGAGLGETARFALFTVGVAVILVVLAIYLLTARHLSILPAVSMALVVGGGLGNLIDRMAREGAVVDFLNVGIGPIRTGIFNMADVFIVAGVGVLLLWSLFSKDPQVPAQMPEPPPGERPGES